MEGELIVVKTNDGSPTLFVPELNEHYHSIHGAYTEAMHVFYKNGLELCSNKKTLSIFEMGFGTGLNALVATYYHLNNDVSVYYESIENKPVPQEITSKISYASFFDEKGNQLQKLESAIKNNNWNEPYIINEIPTSFFRLNKINRDILEYNLKECFFDLIFFDAFGPRAQNEMWQPAILEKMYLGLKKEGTLVTYCANGQMKRDLKHIGFNAKSLPGPPGKREMTIAIK